MTTLLQVVIVKRHVVNVSAVMQNALPAVFANLIGNGAWSSDNVSITKRLVIQAFEDLRWDLLDCAHDFTFENGDANLSGHEFQGATENCLHHDNFDCFASFAQGRHA